MEEAALTMIKTWMVAHPEASARLFGAILLLTMVGNFCKAIRKMATARKWKLSARQKIALDIGAMLGNVIWGIVALGKAFVRGEDPDHTDEPPPST